MLLLLIMLAQPLGGPGGSQIYRVDDRDSFIQAIGSDRTIIIEEGAEIILSYSNENSLQGTSASSEDSIEYPETSSVSWRTSFDGTSLVIHDVENLIIIGEGDRESSLLVQPRYAFVLIFQDCSDLHLENITLGHTDYGYCYNGVLRIENSSDVSVENCLLFGCGVEGLTILNSSEFRFIDSEISDCTLGIMTCTGSDGLYFENSIFRNNRDEYGIDLYDCRDVAFYNCIFRNNFCSYCDGFFSNSSESTAPENIVILEACVFDGIACPALFNDSERFDVRDCNIMRIRSCYHDAGFYTFEQFHPEDLLIEAVCTAGFTLPFYENLDDSIPCDSIRREEAFPSFNLPVWMAGHITDGYERLVLRSIATRLMDNGNYRYEVIIDGALDRTMWVEDDEDLLRVMSWPEFLCTCLLSPINTTDNPLREEPDDNAAVIVPEGIQYGQLINPSGVDWRGEWLLVESLNAPWEPVEQGWVRWTDGDSLLIYYYLFY